MVLRPTSLMACRKAYPGFDIARRDFYSLAIAFFRQAKPTFTKFALGSCQQVVRCMEWCTTGMMPGAGFTLQVIRRCRLIARQTR